MKYFYEDVCEQPMDYTDFVVAEMQENGWDSDDIDEYVAGTTPLSGYGEDAADWEEEYNSEYLPTMTCERMYKWINITVVAGIAIFVLYKLSK